MSQIPLILAPRNRVRKPLMAAAVAAIAMLAVAAVWSPQAVLQGWLAAFVLWSGIPIGSLVLLLIHRLTGGRWGDALTPVLLPLAATMPLVALAFVPVGLGVWAIFPWATQPVEPVSLAHYYLNAPWFLVRAVIALAGFSWWAIRVAINRCSRLMAGIGLAFYGLMINLISVDWILSVQPGFGSSAFGMEISLQQMLSALALAALLGTEQRGDAVTDDIGGFLIATVLGTFYIGLMTFIVGWYGDLPAKAAWYLARSRDGWAAVIGAAVAVGAVLPLALLLRQHVRDSRRWLQIVGGLVLTGVALHVAWLMGPALAPYAMVAAALALIVLICQSLGLAGAILTFIRERAAHD